MRLIRVAAAALNQTPLDWDGNLANIRQAIDMARSRGVSLLCLPELSIYGVRLRRRLLLPRGYRDG